MAFELFIKDKWRPGTLPERSLSRGYLRHPWLDSTLPLQLSQGGHWERWEALILLVLAHETISRAALSEALHRLGRRVGVDDPAPEHRLEISRAQEQLKETAWATRRSIWHRSGRPRAGP